MDEETIEVRTSPIHGNGVFATRRIPRRTRIGVYEGRRYAPGESIEAREDGSTYLFALSDGSTIDGAEGGNATRFINHSCRPNCAASEVLDEDDEPTIEVRTVRSIPVGAELFIDYALIRDPEDETPYTCACGAAECRGTMTKTDPP